jgi:hypothetical protein
MATEHADKEQKREHLRSVSAMVRQLQDFAGMAFHRASSEQHKSFALFFLSRVSHFDRGMP